MNKEILLLILFAAAVVGAGWSYKNVDFQDNQVLVYLTGTQLAESGAPAAEAPSRFAAGAPVEEVKINGKTAKCRYTRFARDSQAVGTDTEGGLENAAAVPLDGPYFFVTGRTLRQARYWGTTELVNTLEVAACGVLSKTGSRMEIRDLSLQNGGEIDGHKTHERGIDADVSLMCNAGGAVKPCIDGNKFDAASGWVFIKALAEKTPIRVVILDPRLIQRLKTYAFSSDLDADYSFKEEIFKTLFFPDPEENHFDHFHVKINCPKEDSRCGQSRGGFRFSVDQVIEEETGPDAVATGEFAIPAALSDEELIAKADADPNKCLYFDDLNPIIQFCSKRYGVNENLIKAVMIAESGEDCSGNGGAPRSRSSADARGLMQLTESSVKDTNRPVFQPDIVYPWPATGLSPSLNICGGAKELATYWVHYKNSFPINNVEDVLKAYNAGIGKFASGLVPSRTLDYIRRIKQFYTELSNQPFPATPEAPGSTITAKVA